MRNGRHITARRGGFTLVEGLLAGVILAAVGAAVGGAVIQSLRMSDAGRDYELAAELLDATLTRIDLIGPDRVLVEGPISGAFEPPYERFQWVATIEESVLLDLYEVEVTVTWPVAGGRRSATVATRLYSPAGSRDPSLVWETL